MTRELCARVRRPGSFRPRAVARGPGSRASGVGSVVGMADERAAGKRPFWLHQLAEYILGLALVVVGVQSPTPAVPCVVAAVIIINAAITKAPFAAFHLIGRRTHRVADVAVIGFEVVAAVQPVFSVEATTRMIM